MSASGDKKEDLLEGDIKFAPEGWVPPEMPSHLTEEELAMNADYEWCLHDPEVRRLYGGQVVIASRRRVWGAGSNHLEAYNAARHQPGCPDRFDLVFVPVPPLPTPDWPFPEFGKRGECPNCISKCVCRNRRVRKSGDFHYVAPARSGSRQTSDPAAYSRTLKSS
jgi:hypothetical protein